MDRKVLVVILSILIALLLLVGAKFIYECVQQPTVENAQAEAGVAVEALSEDEYAGREEDAIKYVRGHEVLNPEYVDAFIQSKKSGTKFSQQAELVSIGDLVDAQFLEKKFHMTFLKDGKWRALHLDTDFGVNDKPDPLYEVYLDYKDGDVVVGPVWIVDVSTRVVVARNDLARAFERNLTNYASVEENLKRPASVVHAITSHQFASGIDLGGVFLLHFLKQTSEAEHLDDQIIGWTVMHEFENDFSAYFQWKEVGETRVAKFRFNWETKGVTPVGLYAVDLMSMGNEMTSVKPVNIYPNEYVNNLRIPRMERWPKNHACRKRDYKELCTAFVKVLEEQEFMSALAWLLTNGEPDANRRVNMCKENHKCGWVPKIAPSELNPENRSDLIQVDYHYQLNGRDQNMRFLVDSTNETVTPLDKLSQWAYWSVTPRM